MTTLLITHRLSFSYIFTLISVIIIDFNLPFIPLFVLFSIAVPCYLRSPLFPSFSRFFPVHISFLAIRPANVKFLAYFSRK